MSADAVCAGIVRAGRHHSRRGRYFYYGVPGVYFAPRYTYPRKRVRRSRNACSYWSRRCIANWGYGNANYRGCMRYHRCY